jgi:DNA-binding transcriptional regulator LsrR (DeoR family)
VTTGVRTILKWKGQLAWKAGRKKAEVARSLGVDRSTVAKYTAKASVR